MHHDAVQIIRHFDLAAQAAGGAGRNDELEHLLLHGVRRFQFSAPFGIEMDMAGSTTHRAAALRDDTGYAVIDGGLHDSGSRFGRNFGYRAIMCHEFDCCHVVISVWFRKGRIL